MPRGDPDPKYHRHREWHLRNPDYARQWREDNPDKIADYRRRHAERKRAGNLKTKFGLTIAQYDALFDEQNGLCGLCQRPEHRVRNGKIKRLAVDHCHRTGRRRSLLCQDCNTGLGLFEDDPDRLLKAVRYVNSR